MSILKLITVILFIFFIPKISFTNSNQWSVNLNVKLGSGSGFILLGYYYTTNDSPTIGTICYTLGVILITASIFDMYIDKNMSPDMMLKRPQIYFITKQDYIGTELRKYF